MTMTEREHDRIRVLSAILVAGLAAGACDITYAMTAYGVFHHPSAPPERILQVIASGVLGPASFTGGMGSALLGLVLHFTITLCMAAAYVGVSLAVPALRQRWIVLGPLYGVFLFVFMNAVIVPLSNAKGGWPSGWYFVGEVASHVIGVGLVIAGVARACLGPR